MQSLFGVELPTFLVWVLAFVIVFALLGLLALVLRKLGGGRLNLAGHGGKSKQARLAIVDALALDRQRQLVVVRRDGAEHLLLIGGPNDLLIETDIQRAAASGAVAPREQAEASAAGRPAIRAAAPTPAVDPPAQAPTPLPGGRPQLAAEIVAESTPVKRAPGAGAAPPRAAPPRPVPAAGSIAEPPPAKTAAEQPRLEPHPPPPRSASELVVAPEGRARAEPKAEPEPWIEPELKMGPDQRIAAEPRNELGPAAAGLPLSPAPPTLEPEPRRPLEDQPNREPPHRSPPAERGEARPEAVPAPDARQPRAVKAPPPPEPPSAAARNAKAELSDMARRLEEALRKPFMAAATAPASPSPPPAPVPAPPARPTLAPIQATSGPAPSPGKPLPPGEVLPSLRPRAPMGPTAAGQSEARQDTPAPAESSAIDLFKAGGSQVIAGEDPNGLDELEQEMKRLLGRVALKPEIK